MKLRLRWSVLLVNIAAFRAFPAGVSRIDQDDRDTKNLTLIRDKAPELCERPAMQRSPLAATNRYPGPDMRQIFQRDTSAGALRRSYDALADVVIYDPTAEKPTHFSRWMKARI